MFISMKSYGFLTVFLILVSYPTFNLLGQDSLRYEGPFQIGKYKGAAAFTYRIVDTDTVYNGPFEFQRSNLSALIAKEDVSFLFKGAFKAGFPDGPWRFQFAEFQSNSNSEVIDYEYRVRVSGIQETAAGRIKKGKPQGHWVYEVNQIIDSEVKDTLFRSSIEFENGIPLRSFRMENDKSTLVGRFLRDGLAHDEWVLYSNDAIESSQSWYFNNGRLETIQLQKEGERKVFDVYGKNFKAYKTINLDQRFLNTLKVWMNLSDSTALQKGIPVLVSENAKYYQKLDKILSRLGESSFQPELKVKVPFFPLDSMEIAHMEIIKKLYKSSSIVSDSLLSSTQLNILKRSDEEILFLYTALDEISKKFLHPLGRIVAYDEEGILAYMPFEHLVAEAWPDGFPDKEIMISSKGSESKAFVGPKASQFNFSENTFATLHQLAEYAKLSVDSISSRVSPRLASVKQRKEFMMLEKRMISQIQNMDRVIDSVKKELPSDFVSVLDQIKKVADSSLNKYSNINPLDVKMEFGRALVNCFDHLGKLEGVILNLAAKKEEIKSTYEDEVWNPFMANLMTEEVKKRLTNAYAKVLLPYLLTEASTNLSCDNAATLVTQFESTHQRMLELRTEDTKKLERKLKRERDARVIMKLFEIEPQGKKEE